MKTFHFKSGSYSLISSGTLITFERNDLTISFQLPAPDNKFYDIDLVFKFLQDTKKDPGFGLVNPLENIAFEDVEGIAEYNINIYNADNVNHVSNEAPVKLVEHSGVNLYLNFVAYGELSSTEKILHYSIYTD
jgi:hypothetical protein